jgi:hypothetical protein
MQRPVSFPVVKHRLGTIALALATGAAALALAIAASGCGGGDGASDVSANDTKAVEAAYADFLPAQAEAAAYQGQKLAGTKPDPEKVAAVQKKADDAVDRIIAALGDEQVTDDITVTDPTGHDLDMTVDSFLTVLGTAAATAFPETTRRLARARAKLEGRPVAPSQ